MILALGRQRQEGLWAGDERLMVRLSQAGLYCTEVLCEGKTVQRSMSVLLSVGGPVCFQIAVLSPQSPETSIFPSLLAPECLVARQHLLWQTLNENTG